MPIPFTGEHLRRLQAAFLDAFDYGALRQMLQLYLEQDLDRLVAFRTANLEEMVHDLIRHYAAELGGIHRLLTAAHNARPADVLLNALYSEYIILDFAAQAPPADAPSGLFTASLPYTQALPLRKQVGDKGGEATTLTNIGSVYSDLGDKQEALRYFTQALPLLKQVDDRWHESTVAFNLALLYEEVGDLPAAAALLREVVTIDDALNHPNQARHQAALARIQRQAA